MDKYEYRVKTEQMLEHMERKRYKKAMEIADTIDWRRVKNPAMLNSVSEIYEFNGEYQKSRDVLFVAYDRAPNSRKTIYRLGTLALRLNDVDEASDCYEEFVKLAPKDPNQYILKYKILKARRAPLSEQIDALEEFKKAEYIEKWAYELACLYDQTGMTAECLEECDDLILWFSEGKYVYKAMELKMKYKPLTPLQQEKYNSQKKAYEHPLVESEEAEEQQEEEAKAVEEAPENAVAESPEKDTDKGEDKGAETSILREEPKEVSTEDIAAKALAAVAETEEVPLTAEKKEAEESEEPAEKPHKRSGLRQSVKGATLAEALKKGMAVANGENQESKALNKSVEDLRVTGQIKIEVILQTWEAKQKDNAEAIEIQKKKDEEILAQKKLEAEKRREEEARRIEEQQRAAEEARRIAEQKAAEEARRAAARRAEEERLLAEQRAEEERRRAILREVKEKGKVRVAELSKELDCSEVTIRSDIKNMDAEGLLKRTHGGAVKIEKNADRKYQAESIYRHTDRKKKIAAYAYELLEDRDTIIIDDASSSFYLALNIKNHPEKRLAVVTNSLLAGNELAGLDHVELYMVATMGDAAVQNMEQFHVDKAFIGVHSINFDVGLTSIATPQMEVKKAILRAAEEVYVLADSSKFGGGYLSVICPIHEVKKIITDGEVSRDNIKKAQEMEIPLLIAR